MTRINGWKRKEFTTRGADPTTVVEWSKDGITITEFQNVYKPDGLYADLHKALETVYEAQRELDAYHEQDGVCEHGYSGNCRGCNPDA